MVVSNYYIILYIYIYDMIYLIFLFVNFLNFVIQRTVM